MSGAKKAAMWFGIVLGGLIVLLILCRIALGVIFGAQLRNTIAELKKQGKLPPIEEVIPKPVPDDQNAALPLNQAFTFMTMGEGGKPYVPNEDAGTSSKVAHTLEKAAWVKDFQWSTEQAAEVRKALDSPEMQNVLKCVAEAAGKPACNFNLSYKDGPGMVMMPMPHLRKMWEVAWVLAVKAVVEARAGQTDQALDTVALGLRMGNHLKTEPILISQLVRVAVDTTMLGALQEVARAETIPVEKAAALVNELSTHGDPAPFVRSLNGERMLFEWVMATVNAGKVDELASLGIPTTGSESGSFFSGLALRAAATCYSPILKRDYAAYLRLISRIGDLWLEPYYRVAQVPGNLDFKQQIPSYALLTRLLIPMLGHVTELIARHQAYVDVARVGLALKLAKQADGAFPERMDKLVPRYLDKVPPDPFTGKELIYRPSKDAFILYSIGPNLKDDGGRWDDRTDYDIVWKE